MFKIPQEILDILSRLEKGGFEGYLVGGCVRDLLTDKTPKDWDITTNAKPEQVQKIFPKSVYENHFGTVRVLTDSYEESLKVVEITPFRLEAKYSDKRHPDEIRFAEKLEDDLKRRDFTVNAMAMKIQISNLKSQNDNLKFKIKKETKLQISNYEIQLIDLFNGQKDLKNKIIRTVGDSADRFNEDALRILRALRFTAELGFKIEKNIENEIRKNIELLKIVSKERVRDELIKIIMSKKPEPAFYKMQELGILKIILPELEQGYGVTQNKHHIYTVFEHNIRALGHAAKNSWPLDVRLASLLHDIGKPTVKHGKGPDSTFYSHETIGAKMAGGLLRHLRFPAKMSQKVIKLVRWHLFFSDTEKITLSAVRRIIRNVGRENVWDLMKVRFSDRVGMGRPKQEPYRLRKYESMVEEALRAPISVKMLNINGDDIMKLTGEKPSMKIGFILNILLEEALDEPELNKKEILEKRVLELAALSEAELTEIAKKAKQKNAHLEELKIREIRKKYYVI